MRNLLRFNSHRIHQAQLGVLVWLGAFLIHQAQALYRSLHIGYGSWRWENLSTVQIIFSGFDYLFFDALLILVGLILVFVADVRSKNKSSETMQDLLRCVEAAATGDLTRIPEQGISDDVGDLSRAVGRLIKVLARSENLVYHLSTLVESSGEAIISFTLDGTILSWNKGAQRIYGYSAEEARGRSIAFLSTQEEEAEIMQYVNKVREGERLPPFETRQQARNGRTVTVFARVSAIFDSTRTVIGASFCAQELTEIGRPQPKVIEEIRPS